MSASVSQLVVFASPDVSSAVDAAQRVLGERDRFDRVLVVTGHDGRFVEAYYAWCMAQLTVAASPERLRKGAGGYPQPVALLARLGADIRHEGRGLGAALLQDVFARLPELTEDVGCRGLLVHAESAEAEKFDLHLVPEFEESPTRELHPDSAAERDAAAPLRIDARRRRTFEPPVPRVVCRPLSLSGGTLHDRNQHAVRGSRSVA